MKDPASQEPLAKIVVHTKDGVIKGYCDAILYDNISDAFRAAPDCLEQTLELRQASTQVPIEVPLHDAKAVFFVKQFEGQRQRRDLRFHSVPVSTGLWVEVGFADGERIEGIVENSAQVLMQAGFFLVPTDPGSNNRLIYVLKHAVRTFRVLGLRQL
jgi:hypothetical protein